MQKNIFILLALISSSFCLMTTDEENPRQKILLDYDWEFKFKGEDKWRNINIPHDYSIIQKFTDKCEGESGFLPGGSTLYQKKFVLPKMENKFTAVIYFYGVYKEAYVSLNGKALGDNHYGYNSFAFDATNVIIADGEKENLLEVRVEHELPSSRWYSGSGILRSVELIITNPIHVDVDGLKITTPDIEKGKGTVKVDTELKNDGEKSGVKIGITIKDKEGKTVGEFTGEEKEVEGGGKVTIITSQLEVEKPALWSDIEPNLYTLELQVIVGEDVVDTYSSRFGFRYFKFNKQQGFIINGTPRKLHGVSNHHDYGALGAIDNYDAAYKRFKQLKEMGVNSVRTTHNTPHRTWIDICDELGIYVIEEIYDGWNFDKNGNGKDFSQYFNVPIKGENGIIFGRNGMTWAEFVVKVSVKRDRNAPSIIMWSVGNEVNSFSKEDDNTPNIAKNLILWGQEIDNTRPYTQGENDSFRFGDKIKIRVCEEVQKSGGVVGYNYANHNALKDGAEKYGAIYLSESASALNSRAVYSNIENGGGNKKNDGKFHLTSYDVSYPGWASTAHYSLWSTLSQDYVSGQFVWTGHDYIGEPTPWNGNFPGSQTNQGPIPNSAYFGIIDSANFPKDGYYLYRSQLRRDAYTLNLVTAWDKNNICFDNGKSPVHVYLSVPKADIYRSGKNEPICRITRQNVKTNAGYEYYTFKVESLDKDLCEAVNPDGRDLGTDLFARFKIKFDEGTTLYTKSYDESGQEIDNSKIDGVHSIRAPHLDKLTLVAKPDKTTIKADEKSLVYVEVSIVDDEGVLNTKGDNLINFKLEGEGRILGVDNGDQATVDKFQQESVLKGNDFALIKAYAGKALVILTSTRKAGSIKLTVTSEGLPDQEIEIKTEE